MAVNIREFLFRIWYWYVNKVDKNAEILFMNYGFSENGDNQVPLSEKDKINRYSIQLYHHLASAVDIKNKDIIEIGCGRGGGLNYITSQFSPSSATGIDLDKRAVGFCNNHYNSITFIQGDAQNLNLKDNSYDIVLNVESSHRYPNMKAFLTEVYNILRPGGHFLFTDFRYDYEMEELKTQLNESGLTILNERVITKEVVTALEKDNERKHTLVKKLAPKILHKTALNFAGVIGSETYNQFATNKYVYFSYVLRK